MSAPDQPIAATGERDLGLSGRLADRRAGRLLDRSGRFNARRTGMPLLRWLNPYHVLLTMPWRWFHSLVAVAYLVTNALFALLYMACGEGALAGGEAATWWGRYWHAFSFSVQTLSTIGYGSIVPKGVGANLIVTLEALVGLMGVALATGLLFARFSRPEAHIVYSHNALIAPYRGGWGLMFRLANGRRSELATVEALVNFSWFEGGRRKFERLQLERDAVTFLTGQWVIVHPIDESSPLWGRDEEWVNAADVEIFVTMSAMDETFWQTVMSRYSYKHNELMWWAKFRDIQSFDDDGVLTLDLRRLNEADPVEAPARADTSK